MGFRWQKFKRVLFENGQGIPAFEQYRVVQDGKYVSKQCKQELCEHPLFTMQIYINGLWFEWTSKESSLKIA